MQDARPSNVTACGARGDQAGLQQTKTADNWAKPARQYDVTAQLCDRPLFTDPQVEMRKSADPYAHVW